MGHSQEICLSSIILKTMTKAGSNSSTVYLQLGKHAVCTDLVNGIPGLLLH